MTPIEKHVAAVKKMKLLLATMEKQAATGDGPHNPDTCNAGPYCGWDAVNALIQGRANLLQQEMAALLIIDSMMDSNPLFEIAAQFLLAKAEQEAGAGA